ncbi:MAG: RNA methyltransferase [Polyangiaceae bacterium]|jgi:tRNA G18 (ribose-2'-O)-methylase SpoU|nr:RNA methyltransferase [Polyangiaceae bacterium]
MPPPLFPVDRLDDPRIADYRAIREADLIGRRGLFLAEGEVVLRVLFTRSVFRIRSVFLAEGRVAAMRPLLEGLDEGTPVYVAPQGVMDGVVGFPIHRGLLAAGERGEPQGAEPLLAGLGPGPRRVVALEGVVNHDNVGGIFRNCAAFGADAVLLDATSCDPLYRKAIRVSVGATLVVPFARWSGSMAGLLRRHGFSVLALTPATDAPTLRELGALPDRVALLLGAEGPGLSRESQAEAEHRVRIPMAPGFDSLNVATTSGIALAEVFQAHTGRGSVYPR